MTHASPKLHCRFLLKFKFKISCLQNCGTISPSRTFNFRYMGRCLEAYPGYGCISILSSLSRGNGIA